MLAFLIWLTFCGFGVSLEILGVVNPGPIENGTQSYAIVDCLYALDPKDLETLEIKWYFRYDPEPIYTWIPKSKPQVSSAFRRHVNLGYLATSDPYSKHRALYLQNLNTALSGRYSCRVSSVYKDDFRSNDLTIYGKDRKATSIGDFLN